MKLDTKCSKSNYTDKYHDNNSERSRISVSEIGKGWGEGKWGTSVEGKLYC